MKEREKLLGANTRQLIETAVVTGMGVVVDRGSISCKGNVLTMEAVIY